MTQLIRRVADLSRVRKGGVITIGNFDGVHLGHQALLHAVTATARAHGGPSIVLTFEPQPLEFLLPDTPVPRLTDWRQKFSLLAAAGIDVVVMLPFDAALAALSPERFMQTLLRDGLGIRHIVTGSDFRFGQGRKGSVALLKMEPAWTLEEIPDSLVQGDRVSSSRIRTLLLAGQFEQAAALLGRPFTMDGRVMYGDQRGRQLGFPTANIRVSSRIAPVSGVYAVRASSDRLPLSEGVANVGVRPTIGGNRRLLEVHLFRFNEEIYGRRLQVEFCQKLRDECRFASLDLLKEQIAKDVRAAEDYFERAGN